MKKSQQNTIKRLKNEEKCVMIICGEDLNIAITSRISKNNCQIFAKTKKQKEVLKKTRMSSQNLISVVDAAKYLIQFFYKSGQKYHCTKTKVEKMLTIAFLTFVKTNQKLFSSKIYIGQCGTYIPLLSRFIYGDIVEGEVCENNSKISKDTAFEGTVPPLYNTETQFPEAINSLLLDIFYAFGNYEPSRLGQLLDEFKMEISTEDEEDPSKLIIDSEKASVFFNEKKYGKTNDIITYIINH